MSEPPVPAATDRLFFALRPDANASSHVTPVAHALRTAHRLRGAVVPAARWHVTLCFVGDFAGVPPDLLAALQAAGTAPAGEPAFDVVFDQAGSFESGSPRRPLVLRGGDALADLVGFQSRLVGVLGAHGVALPTRPYVPHLTLLYDRVAVPLQPVAPVAWRADGFELVRSRIGRGRHDVLARWPLG